MTDQPAHLVLREAIRTVAAKARRFRERKIGEQNTKTSLIEPLLEALGWDIRDPDEVCQEFRSKAGDNPVDYALKLLREPRLFIEAKGLGENLRDRKWVAQVLSYATVAGVQWCVLTDGKQYRFYNSTVAVDAEDKLFCHADLVEDPEDNVVQVLDLISRANLEQNDIERFWKAHYIDRTVKDAITGLVGSANRALVRSIRAAAPKLSPKDIAESLRRLDIQIAVPSPASRPAAPVSNPASASAPPQPPPRPSGPPKLRIAGATRERSDFGVSLADIIASGVLAAPVRLFKRYKGRDFEATLLPDGAVEFDRQRYKTCSTAAEAARAVVTGRKMNTNGWSFWSYLDPQGKSHTLSDAREQFLAGRGGKVAPRRA